MNRPLMSSLPLTHHKPRSRRDFLALGYSSLQASLALPSLLGLSFNDALGACDDAPDMATHLPFLVFDLAGGAALPANFLVGGAGGPMDLLPSYSQLGWNPRINGAIDARFGLPMAASQSQILAGMTASMSADAQARLRLASICHLAQDDSRSNEMNAATLVSAAGVNGTYMTRGLGMLDAPSGGNSSAVLQQLSLKPTYVTSVDDILRSVKFGGPSFDRFSRDQLSRLVTRTKNVSAMQWELRREHPQGERLAELASCAYTKNAQLLDDLAARVDPRRNAITQAIYGLQLGSSPNDMTTVGAALSLNAVQGTSGPGVWTLGGCDYHDGTSTTGQAKDLQAGIAIGRAVEVARRLGKPLFFQVLTDGGCYPDEGTRVWRGDAGDKCMTVMGYYHPRSTPVLKSNMQIGSFTAGQSASRTMPIATNPRLVGYAVFANYLKCAGRLGEFHDLVGDDVFPGVDGVEAVCAFEGAPT